MFWCCNLFSKISHEGVLTKKLRTTDQVHCWGESHDTLKHAPDTKVNLPRPRHLVRLTRNEWFLFICDPLTDQDFLVQSF